MGHVCFSPSVTVPPGYAENPSPPDYSWDVSKWYPRSMPGAIVVGTQPAAREVEPESDMFAFVLSAFALVVAGAAAWSASKGR